MGDEWLRIGGFKIVVQNNGWWGLSREKLRALILEANRQGWTLSLTRTMVAINWVIPASQAWFDLFFGSWSSIKREKKLAPNGSAASLKS
jgi:hypothetical protein